MTRSLAALLFTLPLAGCATTPVQKPAAIAQPAPAVAAAVAPLATRIDTFIAQSRFAHADWGIDVVSLDSGVTEYARNAEKLFVPASNAKLYTAALALDTLGADVQITTTLYATATPRADGMLDGDLVLYGSGDPSLGDAQVSPGWADRFAATLAARSIRRVHGDLIADDTFLSGPSFGSGWEAGDLQSWFAMPVSALSVQGNVAHVRVTRDGAHCCTVMMDPSDSGVQVINLTQSATPDGDDALGLYRAPGSNEVYASGNLPNGVQTKSYPLSVPDAAVFAGNLLRDALARRGIALDGKVRALHWPQVDPAISRPGIVIIDEITSPPLSGLIRHMLKESDNLYAQSLLLQAGVRAAQRGSCADRAESPRTSEDWGLCALRAMLSRAGIPSDEATFEEGTGLSRKDLVTPQSTVRLLTWIARQPFAKTLRDALPVAGMDGTLRNRLRDTPAADNLQAKTGTLTHAYALSGYVTDARGEHLVFSIMLDQYQRPTDALGHDIPPSPTADIDAIAAMVAESDR